ncbi:hypothetical protein [Leucobacter chironomi]|uniref:hypothetical protein n=1 Tax=Leucobacter chironomi TaxID=491918 RepID=UPI0004278356|nr:hypothetical protein [Leucobacter chironomi]
MTGGVLGGGVIFVVAALLWAAVLVPAWIRRREFRSAERNAVRLQRTLRVLAETSEVPQELHLEATAREALAHEKLLRTAQKRQEAEREAKLAEARAEQVRAEIRAQQMQRKQAAAQRAAKLRKPLVRRVRALSALGALIGLLGALVGAGLATAGSGVAILIWSGLVFAASLGALVLLAPGRARVRSIEAERVAVQTAPEPASTIAEAPAATGETERSAAAHAAAQRAAAERIDRARALARARAERPATRENQTDSILLREARAQVSAARGAGQTGAGAADGAGAAGAAGASGTAGASGAGAEAAASSAIPARPSAPLTAREAGEARRAARRTPGASKSAQEQAARERLQQMGVIGDTSQGMPDLDAALRRRRNAS